MATELVASVLALLNDPNKAQSVATAAARCTPNDQDSDRHRDHDEDRDCERNNYHSVGHHIGWSDPLQVTTISPRLHCGAHTRGRKPRRRRRYGGLSSPRLIHPRLRTHYGHMRGGYQRTPRAATYASYRAMRPTRGPLTTGHATRGRPPRGFRGSFPSPPSF